jgi:hypothetical protein
MRLRHVGAACLWVAVPLLAGCFQSSTLVKIAPDGSGTIERTTTVKADLYAKISSPGADDPFTVDEARAAADTMGGGVTFVSATRIDTPAHKGIKAVYAFTDVRTLSLSAMNPPGGIDFGSAPESPMSFTFTRLPNGHSLLTIENDVDDLDDAITPGVDDKQASDLIKAMLAGLKLDFAIQVEHLVKTNVPYVNGGTVTLLSMDFDRVLANPAAFEKADKAGSMAGTMAALREVKGIKITLDPKLTIEFSK